MKFHIKPTILPGFPLIAGALGFLLRLWLFATGVDDRGLLTANHPAGILSLVLTGLVLAVLVLCVRPLVPMAKYQKLFPGWLWAGVGCWVAAAGILYVDVRDLLLRQDTITVVTAVMGCLAAGCLSILGLLRKNGQRPHFILHTAVTVYFMLHLVSQYRMWSAEPQLQLYVFPLLASVFLMLTGYHSAVLDAQKGSRRLFVFSNQAALFFCCMSLNSESWVFYLAMVIWLATGLCSCKPKRTHAAEKEEE